MTTWNDNVKLKSFRQINKKMKSNFNRNSSKNIKIVGYFNRVHELLLLPSAIRRFLWLMTV